MKFAGFLAVLVILLSFAISPLSDLSQLSVGSMNGVLTTPSAYRHLHIESGGTPAFEVPVTAFAVLATGTASTTSMTFVASNEVNGSTSETAHGPDRQTDLYQHASLRSTAAETTTHTVTATTTSTLPSRVVPASASVQSVVSRPAPGLPSQTERPTFPLGYQPPHRLQIASPPTEHAVPLHESSVETEAILSLDGTQPVVERSHELATLRYRAVPPGAFDGDLGHTQSETWFSAYTPHRNLFGIDPELGNVGDTQMQEHAPQYLPRMPSSESILTRTHTPYDLICARRWIDHNRIPTFDETLLHEFPGGSNQNFQYLADPYSCPPPSLHPDVSFLARHGSAPVLVCINPGGPPHGLLDPGLFLDADRVESRHVGVSAGKVDVDTALRDIVPPTHITSFPPSTDLDFWTIGPDSWFSEHTDEANPSGHLHNNEDRHGSIVPATAGPLPNSRHLIAVSELHGSPSSNSGHNTPDQDPGNIAVPVVDRRTILLDALHRAVPPELILHILRIDLVSSKPLQPCRSWDWRTELRLRDSGRIPDMALLSHLEAVNENLHQLAIQMFYLQNIFRFKASSATSEHEAYDWIKSTLESHIRYLNRVILAINFRPGTEGRRTTSMSKLIKALGKSYYLRNLVLEMDVSRLDPGSFRLHRLIRALSNFRNVRNLRIILTNKNGRSFRELTAWLRRHMTVPRATGLDGQNWMPASMIEGLPRTSDAAHRNWTSEDHRAWVRALGIVRPEIGTHDKEIRRLAKSFALKDRAQSQRLASASLAGPRVRYRAITVDVPRDLLPRPQPLSWPGPAQVPAIGSSAGSGNLAPQVCTPKDQSASLFGPGLPTQKRKIDGEAEEESQKKSKRE
ncbi:hypothetical protein FB567DRAFT_597480 [Paraphoma chrysanthemicola]|uniref:Uncharacterized protein n=1 Tax=Paraphoma chrysanthemicola TaxID=798071 RepID=A0A8K0QWI8_9PLEO|nr:hypothetical protein FB567DRAFT_597480 [Paraphoma chrysanthemicola]